MLLSSLHEQIDAANYGIQDYQVFLALPGANDGSGVDVFLTQIAKANIDREKNEIWLIPASSSEVNDTDSPIFFLSALVAQLPTDAVLFGDFEILVELPLDRDTESPVVTSLASVASLHLGQESGEAWLLVRPAGEFVNGVLPC